MIVMDSIRGLTPRAAPICNGVHLVGDWVRGEGMLADAVLASARAAALRICGERTLEAAA